MFKGILVLCTGNTCRSPIAEYMLKAATERHGLEVAIKSAGLGALAGQPADPYAIKVARKHGLDIEPHRARQLTEEHLQDCELVLVMESWQQAELELRYPFLRGRVYLLGKWNEKQIEDPYRKPIDAFEITYADIEICIDLWCKKIWPK